MIHENLVRTAGIFLTGALGTWFTYMVFRPSYDARLDPTLPLAGGLSTAVIVNWYCQPS